MIETWSFNTGTNKWTKGSSMNRARFYPSLVHLPAEDLLLACGRFCCGDDCNTNCEFRAANNIHAQWTLFNISMRLDGHAGAIHKVRT